MKTRLFIISILLSLGAGCLPKAQSPNQPNSNNQTIPVVGSLPEQPQKAELPPSTKQLLLGKWQRIEVPSSTVIYYENQSTDSFSNNKKIATFNWQLITANNGERTIKEFDPAGHDRYYIIKKLDQENLQLFYTATSKLLNYKKLPQ